MIHVHVHCIYNTRTSTLASITNKNNVLVDPVKFFQHSRMCVTGTGYHLCIVSSDLPLEGHSQPQYHLTKDLHVDPVSSLMFIVVGLVSSLYMNSRVGKLNLSIQQVSKDLWVSFQKQDLSTPPRGEYSSQRMVGILQMGLHVSLLGMTVQDTLP